MWEGRVGKIEGSYGVVWYRYQKGKILGKEESIQGMSTAWGNEGKGNGEGEGGGELGKKHKIWNTEKIPRGITVPVKEVRAGEGGGIGGRGSRRRALPDIHFYFSDHIQIANQYQ